MPDKKPWYEGWRKMFLGLALVGFGGFILIKGDVKTGLALIGMGVTVFFGGNVADKIINNKKK